MQKEPVCYCIKTSTVWRLPCGCLTELDSSVRTVLKPTNPGNDIQRYDFKFVAKLEDLVCLIQGGLLEPWVLYVCSWIEAYVCSPYLYPFLAMYPPSPNPSLVQGSSAPFKVSWIFQFVYACTKNQHFVFVSESNIIFLGINITYFSYFCRFIAVELSYILSLHRPKTIGKLKNRDAGHRSVKSPDDISCISLI